MTSTIATFNSQTSATKTNSILSNKELLNFNQILQLFNSAISQEQAWAVLYQLLNEFKQLLDKQFQKLHQHLVNSSNQNANDPCVAINLNIIYFGLDGSVHVHLNALSNPFGYDESFDYDSEKLKIENMILKSIGFLIYDALDYGNRHDCEPMLDDSLSDLLLLLTGHEKEIHNQSKLVQEHDDEGYENEDDVMTMMSIEKALIICINNVTQAEYHYKAVCRALYAQAYELKVFLAKIEFSKNIIINNGRNESSYCFEVLNTTDWPRLWMQVIHELRSGIKLRKVSDSDKYTRHIEYELTPFEILLDQIRTKRYRLRKVSDSSLIKTECSIQQQLKKSPRDIILDFIRSRPTLKPVSLNINKTSQEPLNKHESLMQSIRTYSTPLRKVTMQSESIISGVTTSAAATTQEQELKNAKNVSTKKRLLKAEKFSAFASDEDSDDEVIDENDLIFIQNISNLQRQEHLNSSLTSICVPSNNKKRIKPDESLIKSPLTQWNDNSPLVEDWRALVTEDVFSLSYQQASKETQKKLKSDKITRRYTMNFSDLSRNFSFRKSQTPVKNKQQSAQTPPLPQHKQSSNNLELSFNELCHIRSVLTKVELDSLLFDTSLYNDVCKGKICFSCRKSSFNLFKWGHKCQICKQRVCGKCLRETRLLNDTVAQLPLSKLLPWTSNTSGTCVNRHSYEDNSSTASDINSITRSTSSANSSTSSLNDNLSEISLNNHKAVHSHSNNNNTNNDFELSFQLTNTQCLTICVDCYEMVNGDALFTSHFKRQQHKSRRELTLDLKPVY